MEHGVVSRHSLEDVGEWQERKTLFSIGEREHRHAGPDVGGDVAVGQHHALWVARGTRGVDDGREVFGPGSERAASPCVRSEAVGPATLLERLERHQVGAGQVGVKADHPFERGQLAPNRGHLGVLGRSGHEHGPGARIQEQVVNLSGRECRIDRHVHRPRGQRGEVGQRPLGAIFRQNRHPVSRANA